MTSATYDESCDWPAGKPFTFYDEPGAHDPCYVVMPCGGMLPLNHHAGEGVDIARAKFIIAACNSAIAALQLQQIAESSGLASKWNAEAHLHEIAAREIDDERDEESVLHREVARTLRQCVSDLYQIGEASSTKGVQATATDF